MRKRTLAAGIAAVAMLALGAPSAFADELVGAKRDAHELFFFDSDTPNGDVDHVAVNGIVPDDQIVALALRPSTGGLYAVGADEGVGDDEDDTAQLYELNYRTGDAAPVGPRFRVWGKQYGADFNPVTDQLRLVSDADMNLSIALNPFGVTLDRKLTFTNDPGSPEIVGLAYSNSAFPANGTTAYAIDSRQDSVWQLDPPAGGLLSNENKMNGIGVGDRLGFTMSWNNEGYFTTEDQFGRNRTRLFRLDVRTGDVHFQGAVEERNISALSDLSIPTGAVPAAPTTTTTPKPAPAPKPAPTTP